MTWPIKWHAAKPEHPEVGDCFPVPWLLDGQPDRPHRWLSEAYRTNCQGKRPPWVVVLPGKEGPLHFIVDGTFFENGRAWGGWTVTGDPALGTLTVQPSVHYPGDFHGWIRNNEITLA